MSIDHHQIEELLKDFNFYALDKISQNQDTALKKVIYSAVSTLWWKDHQNALRFAERINEISGITVDISRVQTNMVLAHLRHDLDRSSLLNFLEQENIFIAPLGKYGLRFYFSADIEETEIFYTIEKIEEGFLF